ncbi:hypothetical protein BDK51DRAFT_37612 [Blyttiomyces helicus]|uniref:Uncharacterized protein n=1 Tax=Blyttiomyces helicus TaxID=388810 RepID=A0A4P9WKB2_9FUNG|nr:hypothetical protein BDK51DRAFT_37612 [Blyttiomyces helicus]|eukprot:RKO91046.1 hypothetical protein BDK51DRAFT_37612 [Blyttiomyces helicus]
MKICVYVAAALVAAGTPSAASLSSPATGHSDASPRASASPPPLTLLPALDVGAGGLKEKHSVSPSTPTHPSPLHASISPQASRAITAAAPTATSSAITVHAAASRSAYVVATKLAQTATPSSTTSPHRTKHRPGAPRHSTAAATTSSPIPPAIGGIFDDIFHGQRKKKSRACSRKSKKKVEVQQLPPASATSQVAAPMVISGKVQWGPPPPLETMGPSTFVEFNAARGCRGAAVMAIELGVAAAAALLTDPKAANAQNIVETLDSFSYFSTVSKSTPPIVVVDKGVGVALPVLLLAFVLDQDLVFIVSVSHSCRTGDRRPAGSRLNSSGRRDGYQRPTSGAAPTNPLDKLVISHRDPSTSSAAEAVLFTDGLVLRGSTPAAVIDYSPIWIFDSHSLQDDSPPLSEVSMLASTCQGSRPPVPSLSI